MNNRRKQQGFSLIEVLVVMTILAVIFGLEKIKKKQLTLMQVMLLLFLLMFLTKH